MLKLAFHQLRGFQWDPDSSAISHTEESITLGKISLKPKVRIFSAKILKTSHTFCNQVVAFDAKALKKIKDIYLHFLNVHPQRLFH